MIGFEVRLNGKKLATVSVGDFGVLTGIVHWIRRPFPKGYRGPDRATELDLRVGGLITDPRYVREHVDWVKRRLKMGDLVSFRVVKTEKVDVPPWRNLEDPKEVEKGERRYFAYLKRKYRRSRRSKRAG